MPGLVDVAWFVYQNSGPALDLGFIALVVLGYQYEIRPRLDDLETVQDDHADTLQDKALNGQERDIMLENAHERLDGNDGRHDQAEEARASLRARISRLERREAWRSGGGDDDSAGGSGNAPPIGPSASGSAQNKIADGGASDAGDTDPVSGGER